MGYLEYPFVSTDNYTDFVEAARIVNGDFPDSERMVIRAVVLPAGEKVILAGSQENWQFFYLGKVLMELKIARER